MEHIKHLNIDFIDFLPFSERPFRAKFNPSKIWVDLDQYRNDSKGLSNYFKKWRTKIEFRTEKLRSKCYQTTVAMGGEYDPQERQCAIHIYTDYFDKFVFTDTTWARFKFRLIQIMMHELVHFMQFDRRCDEWSGYVLPYKKVKQLKKNEERKYLSEFDEIQAYAHCIYLDFKRNRPTVPVTQLLSRARKSRDSKTLRYYLKTFNYDAHNNQAIPKLFKQVIKWNNKYERVLCKQRKKQI